MGTEKLRSSIVNSECTLEKTGFSRCLVRCNGLDEIGFESWVFYPGMLFNSLDKWWGEGGDRPRHHEGIDLCLYRDKQGQNFRLDGATKIPVMYAGKIIKIEEDYLAHSLYVRHKIYDGNGRQLYTIYAHTEPYTGVDTGSIVNEGDIIATIAGDENKKEIMLPHVHISMAWVSESLPCERLNWDTMNESGLVTLCDPLEVIDCEYTTIRFDPS
jgi:hypothetical protein